MKDNRTNEILNSFTAFTKDAYYRNEELDEMFKLQDEIVKITFNGEHADLGNLRIYDVERHFEQMNEQYGGIATEQLQKFEEDCKDFCNRIKGIISGSKGESKAFHMLLKARCTKRVLKNVEIKTNDSKTELDNVVITKGGVFIVEVKNTSRDIVSDEEGNYYRTGEFLKWDSHIGAKMATRVETIREILRKEGFEDVPVKGIVVFTNNRIEVKNRCERLTTCFLSQLPYLIEEGQENEALVEDDLYVIEKVINAERSIEAYPIEFDAEGMKKDFADLVVTLEQASVSDEEEYIMPSEMVSENQGNMWDTAYAILTSPRTRAALSATATLVISTIKVASIIRRIY